MAKDQGMSPQREVDYMAHLRAIAKLCLTCKVPMIGTNRSTRQKYCSIECRKEAYKGGKTSGNNG